MYKYKGETYLDHRFGVVILTIIFSIISLGIYSVKNPDRASANTALVTPAPAPTVQPTKSEPEGVTIEEQTMEMLIRDVFGEHSDKALLLLKGKGEGTCSENRTLNPKAVNDNTTRGGVGQDIGLFQINTYWNGFKQSKRNDQMLFDPEINVRIAYRLFVDSGHSFKLWTCGKYWGI